ncbi:putative membrane protein [Actinacidiphila cocklensis]|uniref:Membrane protein n=2 Tax=Actinacidiphila cocklensis TaxID=887465 RepID=A0A9W4GSD4_9ACTN|nr:putative membrane protein [Actinacidiphila cocklensis]
MMATPAVPPPPPQPPQQSPQPPRAGDPGDGDGDPRPGAGGFRTALGGLTTRGRSFVAAGVAAAICAYVLGQPDLLRVGLLLAILPLVCVAVLYRTRYRVAGSRRLSPSRVPAMSEARVHLRVDNVSRIPTGLLMLQDRVPYVLGPRPRFVLDRVEPGGHREVSYRVRSDLRGRYPLGPLQLRLTDPFGMCELTRSFSTFDTLTVVPRVEPLPPVRLAGEANGYGESRTRALAFAGEDDVIPRGYRHGDDLRRVHWRSTAKYGELMVRREEQPHRARCTVLLDTRAWAYFGSGPDSAFEWAVSGAASVSTHMLERGYAVRLLTDTGSSVPGPEGSGGFGGDSSDMAGVLLDTLAVVAHSDGESLAPAYEALRSATEGLIVAFFGDLDEEQAASVARIRQRAGGAVAFVLDSDDWVAKDASGRLVPAGDADAVPSDEDGDGTRRAVRMLREAGWTVVEVAAGDTLPELWQQADRYRTREESQDSSQGRHGAGATT